MGRHCDSRCINAVCEECRCSCGGVNHGLGQDVRVVKNKMDEPIVNPVTAEKMAELRRAAEVILAGVLNGIK